MYSTGEIKTIINRQLAELQLPEGFPGLYNPVNYILQLGGKRIRPFLTMLSANLFDDITENVIGPAMAMEVFHNFTLIHDDIMDEAPMRRGSATVHHKWDISTAILSGDVMLIKAYELLAKCNVEVLPDLLKMFNDTAREVCEGQRLDMDFETSENITTNAYIEMIRLKTSVLLGCCCYTGAIAAGASKSDAEKLYAFGESLGISFQLQDDILDTWGDSKVFGKQTGGDIIRKKKTYLMLKTMETSKEEEHTYFMSLLSDAKLLPEQKVKEVTAFYEQKGVRFLAEKEMKKYYQYALQKLNDVEVDPSKKILLETFAKEIFNRNY
ncbi:MAG TPA: polyprenyl synthetase family protein [Chitinophagales bacterium]|nr:polyprenyl synthetase family protein [Chitinophagales bacterium]